MILKIMREVTLIHLPQLMKGFKSQLTFQWSRKKQTALVVLAQALRVMILMNQ